MALQRCRWTRREAAGQGGRALEIAEFFGPELFETALWLLLEPLDVVAVISAFGRRHLAVVDREYLAQQPRIGPAVHEDMVAGPDQLQALPVELDQGQAGQGCVQEVKALGAVGGCQCVELGLSNVAALPVEDARAQWRLAVHHLQWLGQGIVGPEPGAQDFVTRDDAVPGGDEAFSVQSFD
ncbi:hypothetical protein D3C76_980700 [compost metagenome]